VTLPSADIPYIVVYQRCCRNGTISNVFDPGNTGETFFAQIPPTTPFQNSNPTYDSLPPTYICVNSPLNYNHAATDLDGDVLRYSLCTPYLGGSNTILGAAPNPPAAPPYTNIT